MSLLIKLDNIVSSYEELNKNIASEPWLYVRDFPEAKFESTKFTQVDDTNFKVDGKLTIRDVTDNITLDCTMAEIF